jgi:hypothetical protein
LKRHRQGLYGRHLILKSVLFDLIVLEVTSAGIGFWQASA